MIKSYKIILITQSIILLIFGFVFKAQYYDDIQLIPTIQLLIIGFSPLILLTISIIIQKLIVAVIYSDSTNDQIDKEKMSIDKFWKNAFFINAIFGVLTFLSSIISSVLKLEVGVVSSDYIYRFFLSIGIIMISSLIISLFLRIKESVSEINKLSNYLLVFISILIFAFSLYLSILNVLKVRSYSGDSMIGTINTVNETEETVYQESEGEGEGEEPESESDYYGFNEMSFPDIDTKEYFKELFEDQNYDNEKTQDLTKIFLFSFMELEKGQSFMELRSAIERGFAYDEEIKKVDKKIRKNPEAIKETFDTYSPFLYAFLSDKIYVESNLNLIVDALLNSHEDIYETENPEEALNKIYKTMIFGSQKEFPKYYYDQISPYASEAVLDLVNKNSETDSERNNSNVEYSSQLTTTWIYSFWARRFKEKNNEVVFEILKEIKEHYDEELNKE
ncbi:hypothetical protein KHA90_17540 [Flavobacterium psychroterrae]|uniref:DUF2254 domain-containing protein n=1 Tax=Flavobacterium psychroterrae TaxID=2133767 RepID=A0ABS5PG57_9FLAO|nr:hypothetical protein [Flavobacterium psychroterrae]MBS7232825.1 hypothetical protein [Flavobacterium psychroterrae]